MSTKIQTLCFYAWKTGLILIFFTAVTCQSPIRRNPEEIASTPNLSEYNPPAIPLVLSTSEQKEDFLLENYWNNFDFKDTSVLHNSKAYEQAFAKFISFTRQVSPRKALRGITILMSQAEINQKTYLFFLGIAEKYLFNPNSPLRNDQLYEPFLERACASKVIDPIHKLRFQKQLEMAQKNKPGHKATNFNFTLRDGTSSSLYHLSSKLLLLYFYNPECAECKATRGKMTQSKLIRQLEERGLLHILSIYPDEGLSLWVNHYPELPASWINGYDKGTVIQNKKLYDLKAIPTLHLLDREKIVLLKDETVEAIEEYLHTNTQ